MGLTYLERVDMQENFFLSVRKKRQHGLILIPTLFAVLLISTLAVIALQRGLTTVTTASAISESYRWDAQLRELLGQGPGPGGCSQVAPLHATTSVRMTVCREDQTQSLNAQPPVPLPDGIPDMAQLRLFTLRCPGRVIDGTALRFAAPAHSKSCIVERTLLQTHLVVAENLTVQELLSEDPPLRTVASPGTLAITSVILHANDLLVIAGGDVSISSITNAGSATSRVTVLSLRGSIEVNTTSGAVSLLLLGRAGLKAPPTLFAPPFPLPAFRLPTILGAIETSRLP
jgi:hypothetical protein